jgi:hypothetical protein
MCALFVEDSHRPVSGPARRVYNGSFGQAAAQLACGRGRSLDLRDGQQHACVYLKSLVHVRVV